MVESKGARIYEAKHGEPSIYEPYLDLYWQIIAKQSHTQKDRLASETGQEFSLKKLTNHFKRSCTGSESK